MGAGGLYDVLGIGRDASVDEIRRAFRTIARTCHPDVAGDDEGKADTFRRARAAYEVLSDPERRVEHDRGLAPRTSRRRSSDGAFFRAFYKRASDGAQGGGAPSAVDDLFRDFGFGQADAPRTRVRHAQRQAPMRGDDVCIDVVIGAERAAQGGFVTATYDRLRRVAPSVPTGPDRDVVRDRQDLHVPPNTRHLAIRRYPGLGDEGAHGGEPGELVVRFRVEEELTPSPPPSPSEVTRVMVPLHDALLGTRLALDTPAGPVRLVVPPCTSGGTRLRLAGKGALRSDGSRDDLVVEVGITVPATLDAEVLALAQALRAKASEG